MKTKIYNKYQFGNIFIKIFDFRGKFYGLSSYGLYTFYTKVLLPPPSDLTYRHPKTVASQGQPEGVLHSLATRRYSYVSQ